MRLGLLNDAIKKKTRDEETNFVKQVLKVVRREAGSLISSVPNQIPTSIESC